MRPKALLLLLLPTPVSNLGSIFRIRRDLMEPIKNVVLGDSVLSLDQADLLIELYCTKTGVGEMRPDQDGFVTFKQVENSLLNSQPHISRRMKEMAEENWVAIREFKKGHRHHGNSHGVRLTESGFKIIEPIWLKFQKLA